ncbi:MAG TPA: four helix bundle protein [Thermodesulfobacteriota bacterium]|nr:four helix bundle protein [Thermodesulfobacteriota bacterium]
MKLSRFEDLDCWQAATELATEIYHLTKDGEVRKDFGFCDQVRRAAVSIASNIAEGKERGTANELIRFLFIAKGSAGELRTQLFIAHRIGYLKADKFQELNERVERIGGMIGNLIKALKQKRKPFSRYTFLAFLALYLSRSLINQKQKSDNFGQRPPE